MIKDLQVGEEAYLVGVVSAIKEGTTKRGDPYMDLTVSDKTASIEVKVWDTSMEDLEGVDVGPASFIYSKGTVGEFKGRKQFTVDTKAGTSIVNINNYPQLQAQYDKMDYIPAAPISYDEIKAYILESITKIEDEELRNFTLEIFTDHEVDLISYPASTNVHHEYVNGLGYHIYRMLKQVFALQSVYTEGVNYDYLICGVIVHDLGKIHCYQVNDLGLPEGYTLENDLHGHLAIGYKMVEDYELSREKKDMVQHLILSHHGVREFGAVAEPMTVEAILLHYIDTIDAKVTIVEKEMAKLEDNEVSGRIWYLDNNKLYRMPERKEEESY